MQKCGGSRRPRFTGKRYLSSVDIDFVDVRIMGYFGTRWNSDHHLALACYVNFKLSLISPFTILFIFIDIQFRRNQTKTIKGEILDDASREFLAHNALKYESDFYWFCRYLFNERMRALQIEPSPNTNTWDVTKLQNRQTSKTPVTTKVFKSKNQQQQKWRTKLREQRIIQQGFQRSCQATCIISKTIGISTLLSICRILMSTLFCFSIT